jgi:hypothetical protein
VYCATERSVRVEHNQTNLGEQFCETAADSFVKEHDFQSYRYRDPLTSCHPELRMLGAPRATLLCVG